jgi:hypothetical protein
MDRNPETSGSGGLSSAPTSVAGIGESFTDPLWRIKVRLTSLERALLRAWPLRRLHFVSHGGASSLSTLQSYSRLEHSLGVFALVAHFRPQDVRLRAAALLHDIGHLPFSHTFEGVAGLDHHAIGRDLLTESAIAEPLRLHGLRAADLEALPTLATPDGMGLDHVDSYVRSARSSARLGIDPVELLAGLELQGSVLNTDSARAEILVELVRAEADLHVSWDNVAPSAAMQRLVRLLLAAGHVSPNQLARMTDAELWAAFDACATTRSEALLLRTATHCLIAVATADDATGDAEPSAWQFSLRKIYSSAPLVGGRRIETAAPALARRLAEVQRLPTRFHVRWDGPALDAMEKEPVDRRAARLRPRS